MPTIIFLKQKEYDNNNKYIGLVERVDGCDK